MANYNAYRLFISEQPSLFQADKNKRDIFHDVLNDLFDQGKYEFVSVGGYKHIFYAIIKPSENLYVFQFAREERYNVPKEGEKYIEMKAEYRYPFINTIIDWERQIVLIENKPSVFNPIGIAVERISRFFQIQINDRTNAMYQVTLGSISRDIDFWHEIQEAERIYSLELSFNPPNLFEGRFEADDLVKEAYDATNFSDFKMKFINKKGNLKVLQQNLQSFIRLIASGGGNYLVKMMVGKGRRKQSKHVNSKYFGSQTSLPDDPNQIDYDNLDKRLSIVDHINEDTNNRVGKSIEMLDESSFTTYRNEMPEELPIEKLLKEKEDKENRNGSTNEEPQN